MPWWIKLTGLVIAGIVGTSLLLAGFVYYFRGYLRAAKGENISKYRVDHDKQTRDQRLLDEVVDLERWYNKAATFHSYTLGVLRFVSIISGAGATGLMSIILADVKPSSFMAQSTAVVTALGTLAVTLLSQYRIAELERLRESGRIQCMDLRFAIEHELPEIADQAERREFLERTRKRVVEIEAQQNESFFKFFSTTDDDTSGHHEGTSDKDRSSKPRSGSMGDAETASRRGRPPRSNG